MGLALGLGAEWAGYLPFPWYFLAILGGPWVAATFLVARLAGRPTTQIASAMAVPAVGLAANTIYKQVVYGSGSVQLMRSEEWPRWAGVVILGGIVIGLTAGLSRGSDTPKTAVGWGLPVGIVLAEAAAIVIGTQGAPAQVAAVDSVVAAALSFMALLRVRATVFIGTAGAVAVAAVALLPFARTLFPVF